MRIDTRDTEESMDKRKSIAIGAGLGLIFGTVFWNSGAGLVVGAALGLAFPALMNKIAGERGA